MLKKKKDLMNKWSSKSSYTTNNYATGTFGTIMYPLTL